MLSPGWRTISEFGGLIRTRRVFLPALLALLVVLAIACFGGDDESAESPSADRSVITAAPATTAARAQMSKESADAMEEAMADEMTEVSTSSDGETAAALAVSTASSPADYGRDVIYRATISVAAADVAAATREAVAIVEGLGGIMFGQEVRTRPQPRTDITFKVRPEDFSLVLERLAGVGELVDQQISADDVTERIVNFESRILTAEVSVLRLRKFLEEATNVDNVALLERELTNRETDLETLRGQLRTLQDLVNLATITLTIEQLPAVIPDTDMHVTAWVADTDEDPCLGSRDIVVGPDATLHFCLEIENTGEVALTDVRVRSESLRLRSDIPSPNKNTFVPEQGNFDRIEPGQLLIATLSEPIVNGRLAGRVVTDRYLEMVFDISATPVDADGVELEEIFRSDGLFVYVEEDDSLSFSGAVRVGVSALATTARFLAVVVGVLLPFLPVIALIAAIVWWARRRIRRHRAPKLPVE